jgi:hypothetical protein
VVLVVHCAMVALGIWDRIFSMCVSSRYKFNTHDVDDEYTEKVNCPARLILVGAAGDN